MANVSASHSSISCLKASEEEIVDFLEHSDLDALCTKATEMGIVSSEVKISFGCLDPNVPLPRKVRYLLRHAYEQLEAHPRRLEKWLKVLCSHGVPIAVLQKARDEGTGMITDVVSSEGSQNAARFSEEHVTALVDILSSCAGKWRNICGSLNLPRHIKTSLEAKLHTYDDMLCLSEVLHEWIVGKHKHAKAPTLENLKKALESKLVGLSETGFLLDEDTLATHGIYFTLPVSDICPSSSKKARLDLSIDIVSQPLGTEVAEGRSTLLEVGVELPCGNTVSYQWVKDDNPLKDDGEHYLGSNQSILCITASLATEGTYTCKVSSTTSVSDQQTTVAVSNPAVVKVSIPHVKKILVDMYRAQSDVNRDVWPPISNKTYINLALVKQGLRSLDKGDTYSYSTIQGDVDDVVYKKEDIGYAEAFSEHRSGDLLLIEGRPGSGKTTLVHKVSEDWAKGSPILKGAKLVFLISLRVLSAKAIVKLVGIMKELFYKNDETAQSVLKELHSSNGEGVCFIIDGLDEYKTKDSVIFEIINKAYLQRSMVILSSRPSATFAFRHKASVYIEVVGFLKNQIKEYVSNYPFTSKGSPQRLLRYLEQHPNVLRMCYLPVHMAMVSYLHDQIEGDLPSTESEMYTHFTIFTLRRKEGSYNPNSDEYLMRVCEYAFQMTVSHRQFIIDSEELSLADTCSKNYPSFNLVTIDRTAGIYGYHNLYTFVHLTFQEYLAAYYLSRLEEQEQREAIREYGHMQHTRVVWKFYCGIVSFKSEDPKFTKILELHDDHLFHCQCAFESQQPATCKSVVLQNHGSLKLSVTHFADFTCLGYTISNSSNPLESLQLSDISTGDRTSKLRACADVLKQCSQLKVLDLGFNELGDEGSKCLGYGLSQCINLLELNLYGNDIGDMGAKELGIALGQCSNLSILNLDANKIGDEGAKDLGAGLRQCNNLSELHLYSNTIGNEGAESLVRQCGNLSILGLDNNKIGDEGAKGIGDALRQCSNLSVLKLDGNEIGDEGAKGLSDGLKLCSNLSELCLSHNKISDKGAKSLGDSLKQCSNLSTLHLSGNKIGDEGAKGLGDYLTQCSRKLSELRLDGNKIGDEGAQYLSDSLRQCNNLQL